MCDTKQVKFMKLLRQYSNYIHVLGCRQLKNIHNQLTSLVAKSTVQLSEHLYLLKVYCDTCYAGHIHVTSHQSVIRRLVQGLKVQHCKAQYCLDNKESTSLDICSSHNSYFLKQLF